MKIGEIYFIQERERASGKLTGNVKIGMVGEKGESANRLRQHQTGNPRDLVLHHVTETPSPFWVENGLHQRLNASRVRNEWHKLEGNELENAVNLAESLAAETFIHIPFIDEELRLRTCVSNGLMIEPSDESTDWHLRLSRAKTKLDRTDELRANYKRIIGGMSKEKVEQAQQEDLFYIEHYTVVKFDEDGFSKKYPDLLAEFTKTTTATSGRLTPKYVELAVSEIDPNLELFSQEFMSLCEKVTRQEAEFSELYELESTIQVFDEIFSWEKEVSTAHLATVCGLASGIKDQLTWNRSEKSIQTLDKDLLESDHPSEYNEFITAEMKTRQKTRKRARRSIAHN